MRPVVFSAAVEGAADEAALRRIVKLAGGEVGTVYGRNGKDFLRRKITGFSNAARFSPWIVLVDLNLEAECAPAMLRSWLPDAAEKMCLRVAVHKIESWLLADKDNIANFLKVSPARLPHNPDMELDPKRTLVNLASRSRSKCVRRDICPHPESGRRVGAAYTSRLIEFITVAWQPNNALQHSPSLKKCINAIKRIIENINSI